jgi:hypothetical protein
VNVVVDVLPEPAPSPYSPIFSTLHITCHSLKENQIFAQKPLLTDVLWWSCVQKRLHINISLLKRCLKIQNSACKIPPSKAQSTMNYNFLSNFEICMPVLKLARSVHPQKYGKFFAFRPAFGLRGWLSFRTQHRLQRKSRLLGFWSHLGLSSATTTQLGLKKTHPP